MKTRGLVFQSEQSIDLEPDATTLYDLSRYGNNGAQKGAGEPNAVQLPSGLWVWDFDGTDDIVTITHNATLNITAGITLEAWLYYNVDPSTLSGMIFDKGTSWSLYNRGLSGYVAMQFYVASVIKRAVFTITNMPGGGVAGRWYHLVGTYDGAAGYCYCNGVPGTKLTQAGLIDTNTTDLTIGARPGSLRFNGRLAGYRIYNYALTAGQVLARYEATKHLYGVHD